MEAVHILGVGGGGEATKWHHSRLKTAKWHQFGAIFSSTYHTKQLNPWPSYLTTLCIMVYTASWLLVQGRWSHLKTAQAPMEVIQILGTSHSKSSQGNFQYWYLPQLLVNVYSYHACDGEKCVMVKSECVCVCMQKPAFLKSSHK